MAVSNKILKLIFFFSPPWREDYMFPEYGLILVILFFIAFVVQKSQHLTIFRSPRHAFLGYGIFLCIGIAWDQFAIWRGHWSFGKQFLLGPHIGYMPIEEFGFGLVMPYFGLVLYKLVEKWVKK